MFSQITSLVLLINVFIFSNDAQLHPGFNLKHGYDNIDAAYTEEAFQTAAQFIVSNLQWLQDERVSSYALGNLTSQCSQDFDDYVDALSFPGFKKWAIKMADSTGKFESGTLDGNTVFEGRHAQCVRANDDVTNPPMEPLYCFATWINILPTEQPIYTAGLGFCIPDSCTDEDALILLETVYDPWYQGLTGVALTCPRGNDLGDDPAAIVTIVIVSLFSLLVLVASVLDAYQSHRKNRVNDEIKMLKFEMKSGDSNEKVNPAYARDDELSHAKVELELPSNEKRGLDAEPKQDMSGTVHETREHKSGLAEKLLMCFSLYQNVPLIVSAEQPKNSIRCLNGLRVIAMSCVVLGHTYSFIFYIFENLHPFIEAAKKTGIQKVMTMEVYVDTFFILSAFLLTMSFLKKLKRCNGKLKPVDIGIHYFNRYWRLTAIYMFVMMVYTNLTHYFIADGPFEMEHFGDIDDCATEWWKNMLYINTFFTDSGKFCMGVSWYLCVDMQLFVIAPLFLYLLYRWEKLGVVAVIAAFCGGLIANIVLWEKYYTQPADAEDPIDSMFDIYTTTWCRCPVYFMGMLLGFFFYKTGGKVKMPKVVVAVGWLVALAMFFMTAYLPILDDCIYLTEVYDSCTWSIAGKVAWSTLYRPMWGIWVCWLITACESGYGGLINTFLSWNFFVPLAKLTYVCFLVHFMVLMPYIAGQQVQPYFTHLNVVFMYFGVQVTTYIAALIFSVGASAPLMRLAGVFIPDRRGKQIR